MGGRTKYIVNGHNAQQQTVQNLFQSVQLNINNPHFLIMQGRITKVLNMKPTEILSMVEEAAGTKMFEDRKNKAIATMEKKERKVEDINRVSIIFELFFYTHLNIKRLSFCIDSFGRNYPKIGSSPCRKESLFGFSKE